MQLAIRPIFAEPVPNMVHITLITISLTVGSDTSYSIHLTASHTSTGTWHWKKRGMQLLPELLICPQVGQDEKISAPKNESINSSLHVVSITYQNSLGIMHEHYDRPCF